MKKHRKVFRCIPQSGILAFGIYRIGEKKAVGLEKSENRTANKYGNLLFVGRHDE